MIIRIVFASLVFILLLPHQPDLGLPRLPQDGVAQVLSALHETIMTGASRAEGELQKYDRAANLRQPGADAL